jgi:hypothetical protein
VHAPGEADLNLYAYVSGAVLKNVDPLGLEPTKGEQTYRNWSQGWANEQNDANAEVRALEDKFRNEDAVAFAENKNKFNMGARDALGGEYQAAANRLDAANVVSSVFDKTHDWVRARVDAEGKQVTQQQINEHALALASSNANFQTYIAPLILVGVGARAAAGRAGVAAGRASPPIFTRAKYDSAYTARRHTIGGSKVRSDLRRGKEAHVFRSNVDAQKLGQEAMQRGTYQGEIRGWHRFVLKSDTAVGTRIQAGRENVALHHVEVKGRIDQKGNFVWHTVPRPKPAAVKAPK